MVYHFAECELDERLYQLRREGSPVALEPKVFDVLAYLVQHRDRVVSKDELLDKLWPGQVVGENALTRCIRAARSAVGDDGVKQEIIATQHGRGYRFVAPLTTTALGVSQEEVASSQEEASQKANGKNQKAKVEEGTEEIAQRSPAVYNLSQDSPASTQDLLPPALIHSWSSRSFVLAGVLLLVGIIIMVQYLSQPSLSTQDSVLVTKEAQPPPLPLPDKPSIAVMPFTNMSSDPEQEYFSDGLTDDLITDLSRISSLFVIARHSTFTYKGKAVKVQEVSKELGVRYVLEGSVRKTDDQVRVNAQLVDATTGHHVWAQRYDRPLQDIFTLQEHGVIVHKHTDSLEAYDYYLRGIESFWRLTKEAHAQARQMFEKALTLDPQYAEAYAWLGFTYYLEWIWRWSADPQNVERAFEIAQKAVALNDSLPAAHLLLSWVSIWKHQYDQAIAEGERAIAFDPNRADSYAWQAEVLNLAGRPEEALRAVAQAMRLNPRYPSYYLFELGFAYHLTGQYTEAIATLKEALSRGPNHLGALTILAFCYARQWISQQNTDAQAVEQALAVAQRYLTLDDSSPVGHALLGHISVHQKQYEQALAKLKQAFALDPNETWSYAALADVLSRVGRSEEALRMAEQALGRKRVPVDSHLAMVGDAYYLAGRPEEAIAPLKQFLSRYPNILPAHLTLAAVYGELGKEAEARTSPASGLRILLCSGPAPGGGSPSTPGCHSKRMPASSPYSQPCTPMRTLPAGIPNTPTTSGAR